MHYYTVLYYRSNAAAYINPTPWTGNYAARIFNYPLSFEDSADDHHHVVLIAESVSINQHQGGTDRTRGERAEWPLGIA